MKKNYLGYPLVAILSYFISINLLEVYTNGDQLRYHQFYELIFGLPFSEVGPIALSTITASEPFTIFVLWLGSNLGVDKNIWISLLNVILILGLFSLLKKYDAPWYAVLLLLTNFYIIVLMTSAERLKISYILIFIAFILNNRKRLLLLFITPFAHLQSLIFIFCLLMIPSSVVVKKIILNSRISKKFYFYIFFAVLSIGILSFLLYENILNKTSSYTNDFTINEFINVTLLLIVSYIATKDKFRMFSAILPMFAVVAFIGGDRANMIATTIALGLLIIEKKLSHPLILCILLYFSLKSIPFIFKIYEHGDGFY